MQVEDVKTFFCILALLVSGMPLMGLVYGQGRTYKVLKYHYQDDLFVARCKDHSLTEYMISCYKHLVVEQFFHFKIFIFVPFLEFIMYPLIRNCCANLSITFRNQMAMLILVLSELQVLSIEVIVSKVAQDYHQNSQCLFYTSAQDVTGHHLPLNYKWLMIPQLFFSFSVYLVTSSGAEFIITQAPYAMRGLLIGLTCFLYVASSALYGTFLDFTTALLKRNEEYDGNCGI